MIRRAVTNDFDDILRLMEENVSPPWSRDALKTAMENENNDFFVFDDGGVVAYICVENVIDEGCLSSIAVEKTRRRQGIARRLIEHALRESRMQSVYLEVNQRNLPAIALYGNAGFGKIGERKKYYGEDSAILMRKEL